MFSELSIKALYPLALVEGEGIGTAYEYYTKRRMLLRWLTKMRRPKSMLIAGLPEKYGCSLDFLQLAQELAIERLVVVDERVPALEKMRASVTTAQAIGILTQVVSRFLQVSQISKLNEIEGNFDLCVSSEVLQRIDDWRERHSYITKLTRLAPAVGLFAPNSSNHSHATLSGLAGVTLSKLRDMAREAGTVVRSGYVDMPPFPPGLTRSPAQRARAETGLLETFAMAGLSYYANLEPAFPLFWRREYAHIVYVFIERTAK